MTDAEAKLKSTLEAEIEAATVRLDGRIHGFRAVGPMGQMTVLRPGTVFLAVNLQDGYHVAGVKDGWRLATAEEEGKLAAANRKAKGMVDPPKPKRAA